MRVYVDRTDEMNPLPYFNTGDWCVSSKAMPAIPGQDCVKAGCTDLLAHVKAELTVWASVGVVSKQPLLHNNSSRELAHNCHVHQPRLLNNVRQPRLLNNEAGSVWKLLPGNCKPKSMCST